MIFDAPEPYTKNHFFEMVLRILLWITVTFLLPQKGWREKFARRASLYHDYPHKSPKRICFSQIANTKKFRKLVLALAVKKIKAFYPPLFKK